MSNGRRIAVAAASLCLLTAISCQSSSRDPLEANKQMMRDFYAALDSQDFDRLSTLTAPGAALHLVGTEETVPMDSVFSEMVPMYYGAFDGYNHTVDQVIAEGDWVVARVTFRGTHTGEFQGIPATGNPFTYGGVHLARVADGRVAEIWLLEDDLRLLQQLGLELGPAEVGS